MIDFTKMYNYRWIIVRYVFHQGVLSDIKQTTRAKLELSTRSHGTPSYCLGASSSLYVGRFPFVGFSFKLPFQAILREQKQTDYKEIECLATSPLKRAMRGRGVLRQEEEGSPVTFFPCLFRMSTQLPTARDFRSLLRRHRTRKA